MTNDEGERGLASLSQSEHFGQTSSATSFFLAATSSFRDAMSSTTDAADMISFSILAMLSFSDSIESSSEFSS